MSDVGERKNIEVSAAIICKGEKFLATQRAYGIYRGFWEFPGGKIEEGETPQDALYREIKEELAADILIEKILTTVNYDYEDFRLTMHCFICKFKSEGYVLLEHNMAKWLTIQEKNTVEWLPADLKVLEALQNYFTSES